MALYVCIITYLPFTLRLLDLDIDFLRACHIHYVTHVLSLLTFLQLGQPACPES